VSTPSHRSRSRSRARSTGLPTWSGIAIVLAALITGLLLSINGQAVGLPYLLCFGVAALVVALVTEVRGLFLTVASIPLLFGVMTVVSAWAVTRSLASEGTAAFSMTSIATAVFPLAQFFPALMSVTSAAAAIALLRVWLSRRSGRAAQSAEMQDRRRTAEANRRNRDTVSRARRRTNQVTVEELLARNRERQARRPEEARRTTRRQDAPRRAMPPREQRQQREVPQQQRPEPRRRRRFDDDLYS
jgi:signal transduction histidine kinase